MITGYCGDEKFFRFYDSSIIDYKAVFDVLEGKIAGCIFRGAINKDSCDIIANNFWTNPALSSRSDGVPGSYIGTYHYKKNLIDYLQESKIANKEISTLFDGVINPYDALIAGLEEQFKLRNKSEIVRVAEFDGYEACHYFMRSWKGSGMYSLEPHDDSSQCTAENQRGFEIQNVINRPSVVAINMCIENKGGGKLHYWNIQPDESSKIKLGLQEVGYPYLLDDLSKFGMLEIDVEPGDVYFFNGKNVHAVSSPCGVDSHRTTIAGLMGYAEDNVLVYWT